MTINRYFLIMLALLLSGNSLLYAQTISTFAGNGTAGDFGDGGPVRFALLHAPGCMAMDTSGNIYFTDLGNGRIRKITKGDTISTYTDAVPSPGVIAFDNRTENMYVTSGNAYIYKVTPDGTATVFAGNGSTVYEYNTLATQTAINTPSGIAVDKSGNVFFSDMEDNIIRVVLTNDTIATLYGDPYVSGGYFGDGGPAADAIFLGPANLAFDNAGNLYVSDQGNSAVRVITTSDTIYTIIGNGSPSCDPYAGTDGTLYRPNQITLDSSGNLYFADQLEQIVFQLPAVYTGFANLIAGTYCDAGYSGDGGLATSAEINNPRGMIVDKHGNIYIADAGNNVIRKVANTTAVKTIINAADISLFPNPASGTFSLSLPPSITSGTVAITDILGKAILSREYSGNKNDLTFDPLPQGIYVVKVYTAFGTFVQKLNVLPAP